MLKKLGVDDSKLLPPITRKLELIDKIFLTHGGVEAVLTSTNSGDHSRGSYHYRNLAIDLRLPPTHTIKGVVQVLKDGLGDDYDVILEKTHIHVEYDPK